MTKRISSCRGDARALAARVGVTPEHLSRITCGRVRPSVDLARRISAATGGDVTVMELLLGDDALLPMERWSPNDPEVTADDVLRSMGIQPPAPPPAPGSTPAQRVRP